jgi:hypothetical protein
MIKLADASDLGWKIVSEYETNLLVCGSGDLRSMHKAETHVRQEGESREGQ